MKNVRYVQLLLLILMISSCSSDKQLERRITALERRVATLESEKPMAAATTESRVALASNPESISQDGLSPVLNFAEREYDFGTVNEGEIVNYTFEFTNTGKAPLVIEKATASCGCTVPDWPKHPIGAGETGEIKVRFDTKNKPNQQIKTISITANTEPVLTTLRIRGFVTPKNQQTAGPVR